MCCKKFATWITMISFMCSVKLILGFRTKIIIWRRNWLWRSLSLELSTILNFNQLIIDFDSWKGKDHFEIAHPNNPKKSSFISIYTFERTRLNFRDQSFFFDLRTNTRKTKPLKIARKTSKKQISQNFEPKLKTCSAYSIVLFSSKLLVYTSKLEQK